MTNQILNEISKYIKGQVADTIKLKKPNDNNVSEVVLVHPKVYSGWVPPKTLLGEYTIPCLVCGVDSITDDGVWRSLAVRITGIVYSPGDVNEVGEYVESFNGYIDLINLLDRTAAVLCRSKNISDKIIIDSNVDWSIYEEQYQDYWTGKVEFKIKVKAYPITDNALLL